jgi:hypothetical protein
LLRKLVDDVIIEVEDLPTGDLRQYPDVSIYNFEGDCETKAFLTVSLGRKILDENRIFCGLMKPQFHHIQTLVRRFDNKIYVLRPIPESYSQDGIYEWILANPDDYLYIYNDKLVYAPYLDGIFP